MLKNRLLKNLYLLLSLICGVVGLFASLFSFSMQKNKYMILIIGLTILILSIVFFVLFLKTDDSPKTQEENELDSIITKFGVLFGVVVYAVDYAILVSVGSLAIGRILLLFGPTVATVLITICSKNSIIKVSNKKSLYVVVFILLLLNSIFSGSLIGLLIMTIIPFVVFVIMCKCFFK